MIVGASLPEHKAACTLQNIRCQHPVTGVVGKHNGSRRELFQVYRPGDHQGDTTAATFTNHGTFSQWQGRSCRRETGAARQLSHWSALEHVKLLLVIHAELSIYWAADKTLQLFCRIMHLLQYLVGKPDILCRRGWRGALFDIPLASGGFFQDKLRRDVPRSKLVNRFIAFAIVAPDRVAMGANAGISRDGSTWLTRCIFHLNGIVIQAGVADHYAPQLAMDALLHDQRNGFYLPGRADFRPVGGGQDLQAGFQNIAATMNPGIVSTGLGIAKAVFLHAGTSNDAGRSVRLLLESKVAITDVQSSTGIFDLLVKILTGNKSGQTLEPM